jgi:hypothetical protein
LALPTVNPLSAGRFWYRVTGRSSDSANHRLGEYAMLRLPSTRSWTNEPIRLPVLPS